MTPGPDWQRQYDERVGPAATVLVSAAQVAVVTESDRYQAEILAAIGLASSAGVLIPRGFVGSAGDGRPVETLLSYSVAHAGQRFNDLTRPATGEPMSTADAAAAALQDAEAWLQMVTATIIADTQRAAASAAFTAETEVHGWIRAINPPCCARCIVLAGRFYKWNADFQRHPQCDCYAIPATERDWHAIEQNPHAYFDSLSAAEQNKTFTATGAQAIRDGSDMSRVVNARAGMYKAQDGRLATRAAAKRGQVRLMPESIYTMANGDREKAIALLREHGFIR